MPKRPRPSRAQRKAEERDIIDEAHSPLISDTDFFSRDLLKTTLKIKDLKWTDKQKEFIKIALDDETRVMFISGPAGTSKTLMAVYSCLRLMSKKSVSDIAYVRSAVESSDAKLGFLPGSAEDKLAFYNLPFLDKLDELLPATQVKKLEKEERVSMFPVNFARGMSWAGKAIIFDEAQNSSLKEIVTVLTRIGRGSKCFVLADPMQTDIHRGQGGFKQLQQLFSDDASHDRGLHSFEFTEDDIMRSELVKFLIKKINTL
jgi:phosphate starvation-inducible PhoH-like protein